MNNTVENQQSDAPNAQVEAPPNDAGVGAATHMFFMLCVALVGAFGAWSYFGRLDIVSTAIGEVVPSSQVKNVQHLEGGIVREILVREGAEVTQGQPLVVLESTQSGADFQEITVRITSLRIDIARLEAEMAGSMENAFPQDLVRDHPVLIGQAIEMFKTRRRRIDNEMASQREQIVQRKQEIKSITARLGNAGKSLKLIEEQIAISEELMKDDLTNRMVHLNLLKEAADLKARIDEAATGLPKARAALKGSKIQLETIRGAYNEEVGRELDEKRRSLEEFSNRVRKFADSLKRTVLRSPVAGVVKTLYVFTVGGVVMPGATVVDVVPAGDRLVIEAKLPIGDIGYVHPGQPARVMLASADAVRFGTLEGEVIQVSPDAIKGAEEVPYYKVRIATERDYFERKSARYKLVPGVQVICSIRTGTRSVLEYLLDPFLGSFQTALRER